MTSPQRRLELPGYVSAGISAAAAVVRAPRGIRRDIGDFAGAGGHVVTALRNGLEWRRNGDLIAMLSFLVLLAVRYFGAETSATINGAIESATQRFGLSSPISEDQPPPLTEAGNDRHADLRVRVRHLEPALVDDLGREGFDAAVKRGRAMSLGQIVDFIEEKAVQLAAESGS